MITSGRQRGCFFLVTAVFVLLNSVGFSDGRENSGGVKYKLIHRDDLKRTPPSQTQRLRQLLHGDAVRLRLISEKVRLKQGNTINVGRKIQEVETTYFPACANSSRNINRRNASAELEMYSAADYGVGQYLVQFRVGSPSENLMLIADTGSDLTWMNCRYRCRGRRCRRNSSKRRVFRADRSSTFRAVPCSSTTCKIDLSDLFSLARCLSPMDPCAYDYRYADGSAAVGVFGNETITFSLTNGNKTRLRHVLVGCSETSTGPSFQVSDGVMGLGYSNHSFALRAANKFGGKFSYCLVDHLSPKNVSSYLVFGSHEHVGVPFIRMRYTELVLGSINPFYVVSVKGILIGGFMLDIPPETWNVSGVGGVIVDSGTSLTGLTRPAYGPVMDALRRSLVSFGKLDLDIGPVEYCFNSTGFRESLVPRLAFHFTDGARFDPPVKSYVIDAAPGVKCLGFVPAAWPGACVVGNIMQQNHLWEFDLANGRLGFATSSCA
ncbi:hypothetical protein OROGR_001265 [Orobanche gracilis]